MRRAIASAVCLMLAFIVALLCFLRYLSPKDWKGLAISPRRVVIAAVSYRELLRLVADGEQRKLWNYEIVLGGAAPGETHIIYVPRLDVEERRVDSLHPGANMRIRPGVEVHVLVESKTLRIIRSYLAK